MRLLPFLFLMAVQASAQQAPPLSIIPAPVEMRLTGGSCSLECPWAISGDAKDLLELVGPEVQALHPRSDLNCLVPLPIAFRKVVFDTLMPPEWYQLIVRPDGITVTAPSEEGLYRGSRTLVQLLEQGRATGYLPCLSITDHPRFPWRGMHLDACRHFWSVEFTKKYIDLLARYKMNSFHWHLTDDQGWRIEIKARPKLTEVGAWRKGSQVGPYARREYDTIPYGGFYTQEQIREVVAYAKARHINVVPEIEMPGHAMAALAAYPHLGCTGGPYEVQRGWGVFEDVFCAGNDSVVQFLADVIAEVVELFPGPYIHIGGDECPKDRWKECSKCQQRIESEGLADEHELQSWLIKYIEKIIVIGYDRQIIGWDEILEGGLPPTAAVMSWRGTEGGIAAARSGHDAVMSPGSHCYFDHYQGDPANEPLAFGGYTTLQKVYSYEPIPAELKPEEQKYILGAQGNVWTEYILTPEHVEYMAVPRMLALAEVLWTSKEERNEADFIRRLEAEFPSLERLGVNYAKSLYQVRITLEQGKTTGSIDVKIDGSRNDLPIRYELMEELIDTKAADPRNDLLVRHAYFYKSPITIRSSSSIEAWMATEDPDRGWSIMPRSRRKFHFNKATAHPITLSVPPNERYNEGGAFTLVDGITAQEKRVSTEWLGWKEGVTITVDLGSVQDIRYIGIGALNETHSWIHLPERVDFSISMDSNSFMPIGPSEVKAGAGRNAFSIDKVGKARYVRLTVQHRGNIPEGFPGAGNPAWLFLDEIEVR